MAWCDLVVGSAKIESFGGVSIIQIGNEKVKNVAFEFGCELNFHLCNLHYKLLIISVEYILDLFLKKNEFLV